VSELKQCKLGDVISFGNGKSRPVSEGSIPVYGGNGILGYCADHNYDGETIVIGRVGAYCGATYYENKPIWVSDNALSAKPKSQNNTKFYYYYLKDMDLNQHAGGSSHPLVTQTLLNSLDISIQDNPEEQKAIASVLSSLDDKIDLLHRQNTTLEAMAETLFRKWFVEEAQEDWEEYRVSDFAEHLKQGVNPSQNPFVEYHHYSLPAFDESHRPVLEFGSEILSNKYRVLENTILVSKLNPRFPRIWAIQKLPSTNSVCSTEFQVFKPKQDNLYAYLYFLFGSSQARDALEMAASGTSGSHQRVRPEDILNITTQLPSIDRASGFSEITQPYIDKITANRKQIQTLEKLRDNLLPKLMSGELRLTY
jgi:type I restriction enzyme S subunit